MICYVYEASGIKFKSIFNILNCFYYRKRKLISKYYCFWNIQWDLFVLNVGREKTVSQFLHELGAVLAVILWELKLQLPLQSVPITTNVSLNPVHGEVFLLQHYVIKFVSGLR